MTYTDPRTGAPLPVPPRITPTGLVAVLMVVALSGCGTSDPQDPLPANTPSGDPGTSVTTPPPSPAESDSARPTLSPQPSSRPSRPAQGNGDGEGDDEPAAAGGGICAELSEAEVGEVLGGTVVGAAIPGGGCAYTQRRPRPPAASYIEVPFAAMDGGMDGAKANAISAVEGDPEDVPGIGDEAFVVTGTSFGGTDQQGAGAVRLGERLVTVNLAQSAGLPRAQVRALVLALLRLAAGKAG